MGWLILTVVLALLGCSGGGSCSVGGWCECCSGGGGGGLG